MRFLEQALNAAIDLYDSLSIIRVAKCQLDDRRQFIRQRLRDRVWDGRTRSRQHELWALGEAYNQLGRVSRYLRNQNVKKQICIR